MIGILPSDAPPGIVGGAVEWVPSGEGLDEDVEASVYGGSAGRGGPLFFLGEALVELFGR